MSAENEEKTRLLKAKRSKVKYSEVKCHVLPSDIKNFESSHSRYQTVNKTPVTFRNGKYLSRVRFRSITRFSKKHKIVISKDIRQF